MKTTSTSGQWIKLLELLDQKGITPELFQTRLSHGILADVFDPEANLPDREELRKLLNLTPLIPELIILALDHSRSLEDLIKAGNYDWFNDDITAKRFPITGTGIEELEFDLFHPNRSILSENAITEMEKSDDPERPWMPAEIAHLLVFGEAFPDLQRKFPIIALGSVAKVDGARRVPCLRKVGSGRRLDLYWFASGWPGYYRFLRVRRKVSAASATSPS